MRIHRHLAAYLLFVFSPMVFALGTPGDAFGDALYISLQLAIFAGLIAGVAWGRIIRRTPWLALAILELVLFFSSPINAGVGYLLCIPAMLLLAVFASASGLVGSWSLRANKIAPSIQERGRRPSFVQTHILPWLAWTYLFWTAVSLLNFKLLAFLAIPTMMFFSPEWIGKYLPFLLPPLGVAIVAGTAVTAFYLKRRRRPTAYRNIAPLLFNGCVLLVFLAGAELYSQYLMTDALLQHYPRYFERRSFLDSVLSYDDFVRDEHAGFYENGGRYLWSYSERRFVRATW